MSKQDELLAVLNDTNKLCSLICNSDPDPEMWKRIQSLALSLGHYPMVLNPTPQADEVKRLGDTARLDYMIDAGAIVSKFNTLEHGLTYRVEWPFKQQVQIEHYKTPREAIDAALSHKEEAE